MENRQIIYSYRGAMNNAILNNIINTLSAKMTELGDKVPKIKNINSVLIECCQNLVHHSETPTDSSSQLLPLITVARTADAGYEVTTGNLVSKENAERLKRYIDRVNAMNKDQLRDYYQMVLTNGEISERGGGGLGILKIIRKTPNNHLDYQFEPVSEDKMFFNMTFVL
jgi:hypothetical protein